MNPNRTHVSTSLYDLRSAVNRPGWPVGKQIALDHPYQGMVAMWTDVAPDASLDALADWIETRSHRRCSTVRLRKRSRSRRVTCRACPTPASVSARGC